MCLGAVLGSDFIMVVGGNGALGQAVIQLAAICGAGGAQHGRNMLALSLNCMYSRSR